MESTGVYWKPIYNILEEHVEILLVNARHIKNGPGRKTYKKDSRWIATLLFSGLLKGSFIPPKEIRELRDLTRYKRKIVEQITLEKNRLHRILEERQHQTLQCGKQPERGECYQNHRFDNRWAGGHRGTFKIPSW